MSLRGKGPSQEPLPILVMLRSWHVPQGCDGIRPEVGTLPLAAVTLGKPASCPPLDQPLEVS